MRVQRKRESWLAGEVSPRWIGVGLSKDLEIISGRYLDIGWEGNKQIIRVNQLSESKVYSYAYVNKRITALFNVFGIYWSMRNFCNLCFVEFRLFIKHPVLSANFKSSTNTMVYVTGFLHLAALNYYFVKLFLNIQLWKTQNLTT